MRDCQPASLPWVVLCCVFGVACAASGVEDSPGPVTLDVPAAAIPPPGLCRVSSQPLPQHCDGILHSAPLGSRVFYRPDDGSREVYVCYVSTSHTGIIIGMDVFHVDRRRLVRVVYDFDERRCG